MRLVERSVLRQGFTVLALLLGCKATVFVGTSAADRDASCGKGGASCEGYADCCSGVCAQGLCTFPSCLDAGASCSADSDCCSGNCPGGICDVHSGGPTCGHLLSSCASEATCCDGYDCAAGGCCVSGSSPIDCHADADCCGGHCDGGVCCSGPNQLCGSDADCCAGLGCWFGVCITSCSSDAGCSSGNNCVDNVCLISYDAGWCLRDVDCVTDKCGAVHHCECGGLNNPCISTADCCLNAEQCVAALCKIISSEGYCLQDSDCASDHCDLGRHICLGLPGDYCPNGNGDCLSGLCLSSAGGGPICG